MAKTKLLSTRGMFPKMNLKATVGVSAKDLGFSKGTSFRLKPKRRRSKSIWKILGDV